MLTTDGLIGVALAVSGNTLVSLSLNIQKYVHNELPSSDLDSHQDDEIKTSSGLTPSDRVPLRIRDDADDMPRYMHRPLWWIGLFLMLVGEVGNFAAFGFAPTALVSPLGAVTVVANAIIATQLLKEPFGRSELIGMLLTIAGGITFVLTAPAPSNNAVRLDVSQLALRISSVTFLVWAVILLAATGTAAMAAHAWEGYFSRRFVWINVLVCSLLGSMTVVSLKAFSGLLQLTINGQQQFWASGAQGFIPYGIVLVVVSTGALQIRYLQKAMSLFPSSDVVPTYYVLFTFCTILGGAVVYREFEFFGTAWDSAVFVMGVLLTVSGVVVLTVKERAIGWLPCFSTRQRTKRAEYGSNDGTSMIGLGPLSERSSLKAHMQTSTAAVQPI